MLHLRCPVGAVTVGRVDRRTWPVMGIAGHLQEEALLTASFPSRKTATGTVGRIKLAYL